MVGRFPTQHLPRISVTLIVMAAWVGVLAGLVRSRQVRAGRPVPIGLKARGLDLLERLWIPSVGVLLLLAMTTTIGPWLTAAGVVIGAVVGRLSAACSDASASAASAGSSVALALGAVPIALFFYLVDAIGYDDWEGFMLNLFLALCSIVLCFPLGVLLALGRRSSLPIVRGLSTALHRARPRRAAVRAAATRQRRPAVLHPCRPGAVRRRLGRSPSSRCSPPRTWPRSCAAACSRCPGASTRRPRRSGSRRPVRPR